MPDDNWIAPEYTYKDSDLCVFLLGAGNSADLDLPIMRAFMDTARRHYFARQSERTGGGTHDQPADVLLDAYETLLAFYDQCRASSWAFQRDWDNIEELYTQADLLRLR